MLKDNVIEAGSHPAAAEAADPAFVRLAPAHPRTSTRQSRGWLLGRLLRAADLLAIALAILLASRFGLSPLSGTAQVAGEGLFLVMTLGAFALAGPNRGVEVAADRTTPDDLPSIFHALTASAFAAIALGAVAGHDLIAWVVVTWALAMVLVPVARTAARGAGRRDPRYRQRTVVLGAGMTGQLVARKLRRHPEFGLDVVGFIDDDPMPLGRDLTGLDVLGGHGLLDDLVAMHAVDRVIVAFSSYEQREVAAMVRRLRSLDVHVDIVPRLYEAVGPSTQITTIEGLQLVALPGIRYSRDQLMLKRLLDIVCSAGALLVLAPLFALIAAAVRLETPGPLLYRGERIGRGGRTFQQLKFRTMKLEFCAGADFGGRHADSLFSELLAGDPDLAKEFAATQKLRRDPRVTRLGAFLRRTSLDELPQLVNVLRGQLSMVGPRPITRREKIERYLAAHEDGERPGVVGYWDTPDLRPGLTGYWQISGRSAMSFDERIRLDTAYLNCWSLRLDLEILAKTLRVLIASRGAY